MQRQFLAMWDMYGLEYLVDYSSYEEEYIMSVLREEKPKLPPNLAHMQLRAQFNPQRHYEIYAFNSEISEQEIKDCFEHSPQTIVDAIRECGVKVYSNARTDHSKPVIV